MVCTLRHTDQSTEIERARESTHTEHSQQLREFERGLRIWTGKSRRDEAEKEREDGVEKGVWGEKVRGNGQETGGQRRTHIETMGRECSRETEEREKELKTKLKTWINWIEIVTGFVWKRFAIRLSACRKQERRLSRRSCKQLAGNSQG